MEVELLRLGVLLTGFSDDGLEGFHDWVPIFNGVKFKDVDSSGGGQSKQWSPLRSLLSCEVSLEDAWRRLKTDLWLRKPQSSLKLIVHRQVSIAIHPPWWLPLLRLFPSEALQPSLTKRWNLPSTFCLINLYVLREIISQDIWCDSYIRQFLIWQLKDWLCSSFVFDFDSLQCGFMFTVRTQCVSEIVLIDFVPLLSSRSTADEITPFIIVRLHIQFNCSRRWSWMLRYDFVIYSRSRTLWQLDFNLLSRLQTVILVVLWMRYVLLFHSFSFLFSR